MSEVRIEGARIANKSGMAGHRFYVTDQVFALAGGVRRPRPNTWRLVHDLPFVKRGGKFEVPGCSLPVTVGDGRPGPQLYAWVFYDAEGREYWKDDCQFILPPGLGPETNLYELIVFNCKLRGEL